MATTLTVARMMGIVLEEDWAVSVHRAGRRFAVRLWARDRTHYVDAVHGTFSCALKLALRRAFDAQDQADDQDQEREHAPQPGPALPSPALLASLLANAGEAVA